MTATRTTEPGSAASPSSPAVSVDALDHLVLTVRDIDATVRFYRDVLGMRVETFGEGRTALHFGPQKLNLHLAGAELAPHAAAAAPGTADLCLLTRTPVEGVLRVLDEHGLTVEAGPVERLGATGPLLSVYVRDPDGNLLELSNALAN